MEIPLTKHQFSILVDMIGELYHSINNIYHEQRTGNIETGESTDVLHHKAYLAFTVLHALVKAKHAHGLCQDPDCLRRMEHVWNEGFKKERELDSWMAKRFLDYGRRIPVTNLPSDSSALKIRQVGTIRRRESDTQ